MVSFGYIVIATVLIGGSAIFATLLIPTNMVFDAYNTNFVDAGMVTQQNYDAMNFQHNVMLVVPLVILLGCMAWGIVRALEKRQEDGFQ